MIGFPHRVTVYVEKIYDMPPWGETSLIRAGSGRVLMTLRDGDRYVERVRWWRCGSWRSKKRRQIDVERSLWVRGRPAPPGMSSEELHEIGVAIGYLVGRGVSA